MDEDQLVGDAEGFELDKSRTPFLDVAQGERFLDGWYSWRCLVVSAFKSRHLLRIPSVPEKGHRFDVPFFGEIELHGAVWCPRLRRRLARWRGR